MLDTQLFDKAELLDRFDGDEEFADSILEEALIEIPKYSAKLRECCDAGDLQSIRLEAHTIKGMAANLCTSSLRDIAYKIEEAGREGELEVARSHLAELEETALKTAEAIRG